MEILIIMALITCSFLGQLKAMFFNNASEVSCPFRYCLNINCGIVRVYK